MCVSHAGCSFTFIETVPDEPEKLRYFDCTSTAGLPVADGVFALSNGVSAVMTLTQSKAEFRDKNDGGSRDLVGGISIAAAAISAASAIYGIVQTERCRSAKEDLRRRLLPDAEREQKKLQPSPAEPPPAGAMPGAPTMVEPVSPEPVQPQPTTEPPATQGSTPATPPVSGAPQQAAPPPQAVPHQAVPPKSAQPGGEPAPETGAPPPGSP
jgi:hypothetical protein